MKSLLLASLVALTANAPLAQAESERKPVTKSADVGSVTLPPSEDLDCAIWASYRLGSLPDSARANHELACSGRTRAGTQRNAAQVEW